MLDFYYIKVEGGAFIDMKNILNKIKEKAGYVSIEMIILAGLLIALALVVLNGLKTKANTLAQSGADKIDEADTEYNNSFDASIN